MKTGSENGNLKERITSFPSEPLISSLELVNKVVKGNGEATATLKEIAVITGIGEGTLPLPISTSCQYGIMQNIYGEGYKPTDLYNRIQMPTFEQDKDQATFEALSNPSLYKRIINEFNGKVLPDEKGFANYLIKEFGFKAYAVPRIVRAFFENFRGVSAIDNNNKLRFLSPNSLKRLEVPKPKVILATDIDEQVIAEMVPQKEVSTSLYSQSIPLTEGKTAFIQYPKGKMQPSDFAALRMFLKLMALTEGVKEEINE